MNGSEEAPYPGTRLLLKTYSKLTCDAAQLILQICSLVCVLVKQPVDEWEEPAKPLPSISFCQKLISLALFFSLLNLCFGTCSGFLRASGH